MHLRVGAAVELNSSGCQLLPSVQKTPRDPLTSGIARVYSDGFDLDQYFVLSQFWDRNLLENNFFVLALWSSVLRWSSHA